MASPNDWHIGASTVGPKAANDFAPSRMGHSPETPCCLESTLCSLSSRTRPMSPQILASGGFLKSDGSNMYLDFSYAVSVYVWGEGGVRRGGGV